MSISLWPHGLQHARLPLPIASPGACPNSCPSSWWCHPTISSSVVPFSSCLQSFPASQTLWIRWGLFSPFPRQGNQGSEVLTRAQGWWAGPPWLCCQWLLGSSAETWQEVILKTQKVQQLNCSPEVAKVLSPSAAPNITESVSGIGCVWLAYITSHPPPSFSELPALE